MNVWEKHNRTQGLPVPVHMDDWERSYACLAVAEVRLSGSSDALGAS